MGRELLSEGEVSTDIVTSFSILVFLILLGLSITVAYILERTKFKYLHETFLSIVIGNVSTCLKKELRHSNNNYDN